MDIQGKILISVLAATDVIFLPVAAKEAIFQQKMEARADYLSGKGVPLLVKGYDEASRKQNERALRKLESEGLLKIMKTQTRTAGVKLTCKGDQWARQAIKWAFGLDTAVQFLKDIQNYSKTQDRIFGEYCPDFIPQFCDLGDRWKNAGKLPDKEYRRRILCIEDLFLLGAVRSLVTSRCNTQGMRFYKLLPDGESVLDGTQTYENYKFEFTDEQTVEMDNYYLECFLSAKEWIKSKILNNPRELYQHDISSAI